MSRAARVLVVAMLALSIPSAALGYTVVQSSDLSGNGLADCWLVDDTGDGVADRLLIDGDENGWTEVELAWATNGLVSVIWMDANGDGYWDTVIEPYYANNGTGPLVAKMLWRDADQNGLWENRYYDGDLDNYYEWVMADSNFDGIADQWLGNAAPAGQTATDVIARQVASTGAINILHAAGLSVFFPSATIPLGG